MVLPKVASILLLQFVPTLGRMRVCLNRVVGLPNTDWPAFKAPDAYAEIFMDLGGCTMANHRESSTAHDTHNPVWDPPFCCTATGEVSYVRVKIWDDDLTDIHSGIDEVLGTCAVPEAMMRQGGDIVLNAGSGCAWESAVYAHASLGNPRVYLTIDDDHPSPPHPPPPPPPPPPYPPPPPLPPR